MSVLIVPSLDEQEWPTLGPQVCAVIESDFVFGPGDLGGVQAKLDAEKRALIYRAYQVYPRGHELAGRRRFKRAAWSMRKGSAKTELAAWVAGVELHPDGPVRCDGFDAHGRPVGRPVLYPYIPMVAYTEEQTEELAYGALKYILEHSRIPNLFDIGEERIMRIKGGGKAVPLASTPSARDGALTTFQHFDETHRFTLDKLRKAHQTMTANIPKRKKADAWSLETTTAFAPGERSVAEAAMSYARAIADGKDKDPRFFFFHRQASDEIDISTDEGLRDAVLEASGPDVAKFSDVSSIVAQWKDPEADHVFLERTWLNRIKKAASRAFDVERFKALVRPGYRIEPGARVVISFDGARRRDSTAVGVTEIVTGHQELPGLWEKPPGPAGDGWEVPAGEVNRLVDELFERFDVWKVYADPAYWESTVDEWSGKYGEERVVKRWTGGGFETKTAYAVRAYSHAIMAGEVTYDGNPDFARHVGNAYKKPISRLDDEGRPLHSIQKERPDSPLKIDVAMMAVLGWEARGHAISEGVGLGGPSIYDQRAGANVALAEDGAQGAPQPVIDSW